MPRSANWEHDGATSRLASASAPNGVNSILTYFALPHDRVLQSLTHTGPGNAAISSYSYDYDAVGNITNWTQNQVSNTVLPVAEWKLSMDNSDQLTGVTVTGQPSLSEVFGYDNGGNRLTRQKGSGVSSTTFNDLNQIETITGGGKVRVSGTTSEPANVLVQGTAARMLSATNFVANPDVNVGTNVIPVIATDGSGNSRTNNYQVVVPETPARSFTYDLNGNLTSDGLRTYESDGLNRLVKITQGTDVYEFAYAGFNRRVSEKKNGTLTKRFVWDGLTLAEERDADNNVTKRFFPQGEVRGTTKYFYTRDHLGSVREVTDASGAIVAAYSYDAWGKRTLLAGTDLATSGYTGHYTDLETNLVFAPYRAYDPETGRWLSRDPIGEKGGINLYGYVGNDPISFHDPDGLSPLANPMVAQAYTDPAPSYGPRITQAVGWLNANHPELSLNEFIIVNVHLPSESLGNAILPGVILIDESKHDEVSDIVRTLAHEPHHQIYQLYPWEPVFDAWLGDPFHDYINDRAVQIEREYIKEQREKNKFLGGCK